MSAKITAARRAAFLKALSETGNQTLSAERAKVSRAWVQLHRSRHAGFDAACRASLDFARSKLLGCARDERREGEKPGPAAEREGNKPGRGWAFVGGEEMVVRGTRSGQGRRVQIGRARLKQWTARSEARFLEALAASANVKLACAAAGLTPGSAYRHRDRWPAFAAAWDQVVDEAAIRLEAAQIECARCVLAGIEVPLDNPIREMTASEAIYMLEMFQRRQEGDSRRWGRRRWKEPPIEEVRAEILRKVAAIERAEALREGEAGPRGRAGPRAD